MGWEVYGAALEEANGAGVSVMTILKWTYVDKIKSDPTRVSASARKGVMAKYEKLIKSFDKVILRVRLLDHNRAKKSMSLKMQGVPDELIASIERQLKLNQGLMPEDIDNVLGKSTQEEPKYKPTEVYKGSKVEDNKKQGDKDEN